MKGSPATILLVDDDPADQLLAQEALRTSNLNYDLRIVSDGDEALAYLYRRGRYRDPMKAPRPDLILLDLQMPRFGGQQVARTIKGDPVLKTIPLVILTTSREAEVVDELYLIGANCFIQKPLNFDEFTAALCEVSAYWLERASLPRRAV
jgi:CheY-like chemotaxis protein